MFWSLIYKKVEEFFDQFSDRLLLNNSVPLSQLVYLFVHSSRRCERSNFSFLAFSERGITCTICRKCLNILIRFLFFFSMLVLLRKVPTD